MGLISPQRWSSSEPGLGSPWDYTSPKWEMKTKTRYDPTARRPTRICDPYGQGGQPMAYAAAEKLKKTLHIEWIFDLPEEEGLYREPLPSNESVSIDAPVGEERPPTTEARFASAEEVQKALANMTHQRKPVEPVKDATTSPTEGAGSKLFPLFTAGEEIQRALASLPPPPPLIPTAASPEHRASSQAASPRPPPRALLRSFQHFDFSSGARFLQTIATLAQLNAHYPSLYLERKIINRQWYTISTIKCHTKILDGLSAFDFHLAMLIDVEVERPEVQKNIFHGVFEEEEYSFE